MEKYTGEQLTSFVNAIRDAAPVIAKRNPAHYIISLHGSLPLFDILTMVDRTVDTDRAVYFPGSSRINNSADILTRCFENFFLERQDETDKVRHLASIDEVVTGASVSRVLNAYHSASRKVARGVLGSSQELKDGVEKEAQKIRRHFPIVVYGIKEVRTEGVKMKADYLNKVKGGEVLEFPTLRIITMDDPDYQTIEFDHPTSNGFAGQCFYPRVKNIISSKIYLDLLSDVARMLGIDPDSIEPHRARIASDCEKYSKKPLYK